MPHFRAAAFGLVPAGVNEALKPGLNGGVDGPHGSPTPAGLSSITPSQSSSRPLQSSAVPPISPTHCTAAAPGR